MNEHDTFSDSVAAYALDALPERELAAFEAHLESCPVCRDELDELRVASDALPDAVPLVAPPPELRGRIMAVVEREAELLRAAGPEADRPQPRVRRRWRPTLRIAVPALASAAALGAVGGVVLGSGDGVHVVTAQLAPRISGAHAQLRVSGGTAELVADHLPAPPPGRIYQVWLKRGDRIVPTTALFGVTRDGRARVDVPVDGAQRVMVTDEPLGGSARPTGEQLLSATPA